MLYGENNNRIGVQAVEMVTWKDQEMYGKITIYSVTE